MAAETVAERLAALYEQRTALRDRIAEVGATPAKVSVVGSVAYEERSVAELQAALRTIEEEIYSLENPTGLCRVLPRYH